MYEGGNLITYLQVTCIIMKELEAIIYELIILGSKLDKLSTNLKRIFCFCFCQAQEWLQNSYFWGIDYTLRMGSVLALGSPRTFFFGVKKEAVITEVSLTHF